jgi:hypothetical protein
VTTVLVKIGFQGLDDDKSSTPVSVHILKGGEVLRSVYDCNLK